jgi:hypothetical protein
LAKFISHGLPADDSGTWGNGTGSQFGTGKVKGNFAGLVSFLFCETEMLDRLKRGQLDVVRLLIRKKVPLEVKNMYGGTVLGTAVWSAVYEPRPDHDDIIDFYPAGAGLDQIGEDFFDGVKPGFIRELGARQNRTSSVASA